MHLPWNKPQWHALTLCIFFPSSRYDAIQMVHSILEIKVYKLSHDERSTRLLYFFRHVKACKTEGKIFICILHGDNISQNSICSNYKALLTSGPLHVSQLGRTGKSAKKSQATLKYYISHNFWSKKKVKIWLKSVFNR